MIAKKSIIPLSLVVWLFMPAGASAYTIGNVDTEVTGQANSRYDDNITSAHSNRITDLYTEFGAGIHTSYEGRRYLLRGSATILQQLFQKHQKFNNTKQAVAVDFCRDFTSRDRLEVKELFNHAEEPRSFEDEFGRASGRYSFYENGIETLYTRQVSRQVTVGLSYRNGYFHASRKDLADSVLHHPGLRGEYMLSSKTRVTGAFDCMLRTYSGQGQVRILRPSMGFRQSFTPQLHLDVAGGYDFSRGFDGRRAGSAYQSVALTNDVDKATQLKLAYTAEQLPNAYNSDSFKQKKVSFFIARKLSSRFNFGASAFYGEGTFGATGIKEQLSGVSLGFGYDVTKHTVVYVQSSYSAVDSNDEGIEYDKTMVSVGVRFTL